MNLFATFCVLNVINVVLQTVKSLMTVKCGKWSAAAINAIAFGLYQVILVYAVCDLPLFTKVVVVAIANFVGVFFTKLVEEKLRKDKLWKVEATIPNQGIAPENDDCLIDLRDAGVPMNYIDINKYIIINCYCATQAESKVVKEILDRYGAKYFVGESKTL